MADVNKGLMSVKQMMSKGHRVVFDDDGSFIEDKASGEWMPMHEDAGGLFKLRMWVKANKPHGGF